MQDDYTKDKAWETIQKVLEANVVEQRRKRRWGIFFKLIFITLFVLFILGVLGQGARKGLYFDENGNLVKSYTAMIKVEGVIAADSDANATSMINALNKAFKDKNAKAIILRINSGGGSPVQSGYVYDEIKRLRGIYPKKKVYAVISDIGASGAYYIAAAADQIYADKASLVGSIGVTAANFGFVDAMDKLGIERRLYTSGEHKAFLDPFSPENSDETKFWETVLNTVHRQFIDAVQTGRGDRLTNMPELFSGLIWSGEQAITLGLIDGFGSERYVAREIIGESTIVDFTEKQDSFEKLLRELGADTTIKFFSKMGEVRLF